MKRIVALFTVSVFFLLGCNNTYIVDRSEFKKLERKPDDSSVVTINDLAGTPVAVEDSTKLYVRSLGGRRGIIELLVGWFMAHFCA